MRLTPSMIRQFEGDQAMYGTAVALFNVLWLKADEDLRELGVTKVTTVTPLKKRRTKRAA